jgi:hypothetical protein
MASPRAAGGKGTCWRAEEAGKRFCLAQTPFRVQLKRGELLSHDESQKAISPEEKAEVPPAQRFFTAARRLLRPEQD